MFVDGVTHQCFASGPGPVDVFGIRPQPADRLREGDLQGFLFFRRLRPVGCAVATFDNLKETKLD